MAEQEALWFDGQEYQELYQELQTQQFRGYESVENKLFRPKDAPRNVLIKGAAHKSYKIPSRSVDFMLNPPAEYRIPPAITANGNEEYSGFNAQDKPPEGCFTFGQALQTLYMVRLREDNAKLPATNMYPFQDSPEAATKTGGTIWVGDAVDCGDTSLEFSAMVSIHPSDFRTRSKVYLGNGRHVDLRLSDSKDSELARELDQVFHFLLGFFQKGDRILVHCIAGLSRSVAVVLDFIERFEFMHGERPGAMEVGNPEANYRRLKHDRVGTFAKMQALRSPIKNDNFERQLDLRTWELCCSSQPCGGQENLESRCMPPDWEPMDSVAKSPEHGAGAKADEAIAMVFFLYHLRVTEDAMKRFDLAQRYQRENRNEKRWKFPQAVVDWFGECKKRETEWINKPVPKGQK